MTRFASVFLAAALALASLIAPASADAQQSALIGPCNGTAPPPDRPAAATPHAMPRGYPYSLAACTLPVIGHNANGWALGWACREGSRVYTATYAVRHSAITADMVASFAAIPLAADPKAASAAHWQRFGSAHFLSMADVWCEASGSDWRLRFNAAVEPLIRDAQSPPAPQWRTPASGAGTLYLAVGGARTSIIPGRRAPPGAACNCTSPILALGASYCPLQAGPANEVTLCRQVTP